jgi:hypothetical protein
VFVCERKPDGGLLVSKNVRAFGDISSDVKKWHCSERLEHSYSDFLRSARSLKLDSAPQDSCCG